MAAGTLGFPMGIRRVTRPALTRKVSSVPVDAFCEGFFPAGTIAPPMITIQSHSADKISDEAGKTTCTVVFQASAACDQWEACANGGGQGQGLLVGSGGSVSASTNASFDISYDELTQGEGAYRINIYGHNAGGWSAYE